MKLVQLGIDRLPGIQPSFALEGLDPGVTLVHGPNAIGKSSLVRALRYLVVPPSNGDPPDVVLHASFLGSTGRWEVTRTGNGVAWRRDGTAAEPPAVPGVNLLHCYWLAVEDLLSEHDDDQALLERLRRELAGGFDLAAVRAFERFRLGTRHGQHEERTVREAEDALRAVQREHQALRRDEERLPELDRVVDSAEQASERARLHMLATELVLIERARRGEETGLREAVESGDRLAQRLVELLEERSARRRDRERARDQLAQSGLAAGAPNAADIRAQRRELDRLGDLIRRRDAAERDHQNALVARRQAGEDLGSAPEGTLPQLEPALVGTAEELARRVHEGETHTAELRKKLENVRSGGVDEQTLALCGQAADELRRWLRAGGSWLRRIGAVLAAVGAAVVLALWLVGGNAAAGAAVGAVALALLGVLVLLAPLRSRSEARRRFRETGLQQPTAWRTGPVRERLEALEEEEAELRVRLREEQSRALLERELKEAEGALEEGRRELDTAAQDLGFNPRSALGFDRFVRLAAAWDKAAGETDRAQGELERLEKDMAPVAEALRSFLNKWGEEPAGGAPDPGHLGDALDRLEARADLAEAAGREIEAAGREIKRIAQELKRMSDERQSQLRDDPVLVTLVTDENESEIVNRPGNPGDSVS